MATVLLQYSAFLCVTSFFPLAPVGFINAFILSHSGVPVPCRLAELKGKSRRFDKTVEKQAMEQAVLDFLK